MPVNTKRLGFFTRLLDDADAGERYRLAAEQIVHAERFGMETAWVAQHHFDASEGGLPAPFVFLAQVAARTSRIRLGTGVVTLPLENPLRVAEDAAVLDLLSGGRLEVGVRHRRQSVGLRRRSVMTMPTVAEIFARYFRILLDAWRGEGSWRRQSDVSAGPQVSSTAFGRRRSSVEGGRRAGAAGDGLMLSRTQPRPAEAPHASLADIQHPIIDAYLQALPSGHAPRILGSRSVFVPIGATRGASPSWVSIATSSGYAGSAAPCQTNRLTKSPRPSTCTSERRTRWPHRCVPTARWIA